MRIGYLPSRLISTPPRVGENGIDPFRPNAARAFAMALREAEFLPEKG
jgi:hypothetical protein